jgi:hypothetical protein
MRPPPPPVATHPPAAAASPRHPSLGTAPLLNALGERFILGCALLQLTPFLWWCEEERRVATPHRRCGLKTSSATTRLPERCRENEPTQLERSEAEAAWTAAAKGKSWAFREGGKRAARSRLETASAAATQHPRDRGDSLHVMRSARSCRSELRHLRTSCGSIYYD